MVWGLHAEPACHCIFFLARISPLARLIVVVVAEERLYHTDDGACKSGSGALEGFQLFEIVIK